MVRHKPDSIVTGYVEIPQKILKLIKELEFSVEIMFVNKLPLLLSITKGLEFTRIEYILNMSKSSLVNSVNKTVRHYKSHGLLVRTMFEDPGFQFI